MRPQPPHCSGPLYAETYCASADPLMESLHGKEGKEREEGNEVDVKVEGNEGMGGRDKDIW